MSPQPQEQTFSPPAEAGPRLRVKRQLLAGLILSPLYFSLSLPERRLLLDRLSRTWEAR